MVSGTTHKNKHINSALVHKRCVPLKCSALKPDFKIHQLNQIFHIL